VAQVVPHEGHEPDALADVRHADVLAANALKLRHDPDPFSVRTAAEGTALASPSFVHPKDRPHEARPLHH